MRRRYPWQDWESGDLRRVPDPERTLAGVLRTRAARRGLRVRTLRDGEDLLFQFRPAGCAGGTDAETFAPVFDGEAPAEPGVTACPACGRSRESDEPRAGQTGSDPDQTGG